MTTPRVLEDVLASASGYGGPASAGEGWGDEMHRRLSALMPHAERSVDALRGRRRAMRDSLLAVPGLRVTIEPTRLSGGKLFPCSFDPQNMLPTGDGGMLHTRTVRACNGDVSADFSQPVFERPGGAFVSVLAEPDAIRLTAHGRPVALPAAGSPPIELTEVRLEGRGLAFAAPRVLLAQDGEGLRLTPAPR
jgi:hypothetical protein